VGSLPITIEYEETEVGNNRCKRLPRVRDAGGRTLLDLTGTAWSAQHDAAVAEDGSFKLALGHQRSWARVELRRRADGWFEFADRSRVAGADVVHALDLYNVPFLAGRAKGLLAERLLDVAQSEDVIARVDRLVDAVAAGVIPARQRAELRVGPVFHPTIRRETHARLDDEIYWLLDALDGAAGVR
jgi:hypothetical protein